MCQVGACESASNLTTEFMFLMVKGFYKQCRFQNRERLLIQLYFQFIIKLYSFTLYPRSHLKEQQDHLIRVTQLLMTCQLIVDSAWDRHQVLSMNCILNIKHVPLCYFILPFLAFFIFAGFIFNKFSLPFFFLVPCLPPSILIIST